MQAIILSIGDELTLGQTVDTNSAWLAARLAEHGIPVYAHQTVADDRRAIELAIRWAAHNATVVLVSGGLGPTEDDLTRQGLADAMGVELIEDPLAVEMLRAFFIKRGREMPARNLVQAMHPAGSTMIPNPSGTAPGIRAHVDRAEVFVMPGVPREMHSMFHDSVAPALPEFGGGRRVILTTKINTFGMGESDVAERLGELMARDRNPTVGTTVGDGVCAVRIRAEFEDVEHARQAVAAAAAQVEQALGAIVFSRDELTLQASVLETLVSRRLTLATAESCTGGLIGAMLTDIEGCSAAYAGGWVTYSNVMKTSQLGVDEALLEQHGAVSEPVVHAMARGALARAGSHLAVSVSGIAGPEGGTAEKPVGTVWLGLAWRNDDGSITSEARLARLGGDRIAIRDRAAKCALQWVRLHVLGQSADLIQWTRPGTIRQETRVGD